MKQVFSDAQCPYLGGLFSGFYGILWFVLNRITTTCTKNDEFLPYANHTNFKVIIVALFPTFYKRALKSETLIALKSWMWNHLLKFVILKIFTIIYNQKKH